MVRKCRLVGEDRQLAGLGALQLAVDADDVAQVEALGQGPVLVAHLALADQHLDPSGPVADVEEDQLAGAALQHDAAGGADRRAVLLRRLAFLGGRLDDDFALAGADLADG